jgi:hypothetical protein
MWLVHTAIFSKTFRVLGECGICKIFKCKIDVFWDHPCNIKLLLSVVSQRCRHWLQVNLISLPIIPMVLLMYCALSKPVLFRCPFSTVHLVNYDHINVWRIHTHSPIPRFFLSFSLASDWSCLAFHRHRGRSCTCRGATRWGCSCSLGTKTLAAALRDR